MPSHALVCLIFAEIGSVSDVIYWGRSTFSLNWQRSSWALGYIAHQFAMSNWCEWCHRSESSWTRPKSGIRTMSTPLQTRKGAGVTRCQDQMYLVGREYKDMLNLLQVLLHRGFGIFCRGQHQKTFAGSVSQINPKLAGQKEIETSTSHDIHRQHTAGKGILPSTDVPGFRTACWRRQGIL